MSPALIISCIAVYFGILLLIAWLTSRNATNDSYFLGNRASPWLVVAIGMLGDSLSGVTFISVPGKVGVGHFSYLQLVLGYFIGYIIITQILLPVYYRMNLTSIYTFLRERMGPYSERTGSAFFILSRLFGAAARLFLAIGVLQFFVFGPMNVPFEVSVFVVIGLMLVYTYKGGIKTLVWTDMFQSLFLVLGVILSIFAIASAMDLGVGELFSQAWSSDNAETFFWDWREKNFFFKEFLGGIFIAVAMTGLDQNMMQKNLSCRSLPEAQKNIRVFSVIMVIVNVFFLSLGAMLYLYADKIGFVIPVNENNVPVTDHLFPGLALEHLGTFAGIAFILGLTASTFSSADSVLTTLTTSFYVDFLGKDKDTASSEEKKKRTRTLIHIAFAILLGLVILCFKLINKQAIIDTVLLIAAYTYGPMLGMFAFGLFVKRKVLDVAVPVICLLSPVLCYLLSTWSVEIFSGYKFGNEMLIVNGMITFLGMLLCSRK